MAISSGRQDLPGKCCRFPCKSCRAFCKLRFCIALRECAASSVPTLAQGDSLWPIAWHHALRFPSRYTPRYCVANRPAIPPLPTRFRAFLRHPRAMFYYRLLRFISCYSVARHNDKHLRKRGPSHGVWEPLLLRLARLRLPQDKPHPLPSPPHGERGGRDRQPPHATRGTGRGVRHGDAG